MTVRAPVRIHVMGVSERTDDRGRNKWLEQWWKKHNYQLGLVGSDEASGSNLPRTLTHDIQRKSALSLFYSAVVFCDSLLYSLLIFHLLFLRG